MCTFEIKENTVVVNSTEQFRVWLIIFLVSLFHLQIFYKQHTSWLDYTIPNNFNNAKLPKVWKACLLR